MNWISCYTGYKKKILIQKSETVAFVIKQQEDSRLLSESFI